MKIYLFLIESKDSEIIFVLSYISSMIDIYIPYFLSNLKIWSEAKC